MKKINHPFHLVNSSPWPFLMGIAAINTAIAFVSYMHRFESSSILLIFGFINVVLVLSFLASRGKKSFLVFVVCGFLVGGIFVWKFMIFPPSILEEEIIKTVPEFTPAPVEPQKNPYLRTREEWVFFGIRYAVATAIIIGLWWWATTPPGGNPGPGFPPGGNPGPGFPPGGNPGPGFPPAQDGGGFPQLPNPGSWNQDLVDMAISLVQTYTGSVGSLLVGAEVVFSEDSPSDTESSTGSEAPAQTDQNLDTEKEKEEGTSSSQPPSRPGKEEEEEEEEGTSSSQPPSRPGKEEEEEEDTSSSSQPSFSSQTQEVEAQLDTSTTDTSSYSLNFDYYDIPDHFIGRENELLVIFEHLVQFLSAAPEFGTIHGTVYPFFLVALLDGVKTFIPYIAFNQFFFHNFSFSSQFRILDFPEFISSLLQTGSPLRGLFSRGTNVPGLLNIISQLGLGTMLHAHFAGAGYSSTLSAVRNFNAAWRSRVSPTFGDFFLHGRAILEIVIKACSKFNQFLKLIRNQANGNPNVSLKDLKKLNAFYDQFAIMYKALLRYDTFLQKMESICEKSGLNYKTMRFPFNLKDFFLL